MILNRDDYIKAINEFVGDNNTPEAVTFIENMSDTFDDLSNRFLANGDYVPRTELDELNNKWAKKYRERFLEPSNIDDELEKEKEKEKKEKPKKLTFDDLFKE